VVVGLDSITGLQSARILAARGVTVVGVVADRRHWGARTNACARVVESPLHGEALVGALHAIGDRLGSPGVLLPCTDASVHTVSRERDRLADRFLVPLPSHTVVELLMDKVGFARHAAATGLPVPRTEAVVNRADAVRLAGQVTYPCLVKPAKKSPSWTAHTEVKAFTVRDAAELLALYDRVGGWASRLLVQEWVQGPESGLYSCNAYFDGEGRPLATFVARKVRQWPPYVGTSASGEECRNDEVRDTTLALFSGLGYRGLAYLEMKRDVRTGRLLIIEPNVGRPTGRSAIAEAGGVELLYTAYCDAAGLPLPEAREQRYVGAKWVDLRRDAQAAVVARRQGQLSLADWARWLQGPKAHAIWSRRDPKPFLVDLVHAAGTGGRGFWAARRGREHSQRHCTGAGGLRHE
jgi:predicted ATP-grasp superfamily ATP-dependent carboligase